jgi:hypothetical protein
LPMEQGRIVEWRLPRYTPTLRKFGKNWVTTQVTG